MCRVQSSLAAPVSSNSSNSYALLAPSGPQARDDWRSAGATGVETRRRQSGWPSREDVGAFAPSPSGQSGATFEKFSDSWNVLTVWRGRPFSEICYGIQITFVIANIITLRKSAAASCDCIEYAQSHHVSMRVK